MRFNVEGADGRTGEEHVYTIEAATAAEAEQRARRKGILVSAVHRSAMQSPADALDEMVGQAVASQSAGIDTPQPAAPLGYATPPRAALGSNDNRGPNIARSHAAPSYTGLHIGASVLMTMAVVCYVMGGLVMFLAVVGGIGAATSTGTGGAGVLPILFAIGPAFSLFVGGALLHTISAAAQALRDIARNSFRN